MAWQNGRSGTYNIFTQNPVISGYVSWSEKFDVEKNISQISQVAYLHRTNIYEGATYFTNEPITKVFYFGSETASSSVSESMTILGNTSESGGTYTQVYAAVKEIAHNSDGAKSITLGFSMSKSDSVAVIANSFTVPKTTATVSLTTIPRITTPTLSVTSITMGSTMRITLTPADSSFKHKIRYEFGSLVSQVAGLTSGVDFTSQGTTYHDFTPPTSLANEIPNATEQDATLIVYTYTSNGTHIGTAEILIKLKVPNYTPTISNVALTGNSLLSGVYVQGKSTVNVAITASSLYGATIKDYSTTVDGKTYSGSSFTSAVLSSGSKSVAVTVTDTRGKTATYPSVAFTVYAYSVPSITEFSLSRQSDGTTVVATVKGTIASVNSKNAINVAVTLNGTSQNATLSQSTANGVVTFTGSATFTGISTDSAFTGTAKVVDSYNTVTKDSVLSTVAVTMDFYKTGKGVAFGKVAEAEGFDVDWSWTFRKAGKFTNSAFAPVTVERSGSANGAAIKFVNSNGTLGFVGMGTTVDSGLKRWKADQSTAYNVLDTGNCPDYVIERGTSSGWEYTKWNSGKMELFATKSLSFAEGAKQADNLYRSIVSIDLSGLLSNIMSGTCCVQVNGMVPQVCRHSSTHTLAEIVIVTSRTFSAFTLTDAPIYIIGKSK